MCIDILPLCIILLKLKVYDKRKNDNPQSISGIKTN